GRPLVVNLAGAIVEAVSAPTHRFDHAARIADEDIGVVYVILRLVEHRGGRSYGRIETRAVDPDAVPGAEALVTFALKGRPRIDQREVDVEEARRQRRGHRGEPSYGPATTSAARPTSSVRRAAAWTSSRVTACNRPGTRTS